MPENLRYERKYLVPLELEDYISSVLTSTSDNIFEEYSPRQVTSIYFDTFDLKFVKQNLDGESNRFKFRIRHYDKSICSFSDAVLEIKYKLAAIGYKKIYKIEQPFILDYKLNLKDIFKSNPLPNQLSDFYNWLQPTLAVSYFRKYYKSINLQYRATLDTNIIYQSIEQISKNNPFSYSNSHRETYAVLEVKYDNVYEMNNYMSELNLPLRLSRNSKYVRGLSLLGKIKFD